MEGDQQRLGLGLHMGGTVRVRLPLLTYLYLILIVHACRPVAEHFGCTIRSRYCITPPTTGYTRGHRTGGRLDG